MNKHPLMFSQYKVYTPFSLDQALLRRSPGKIKIFHLSDYEISNDKDLYISLQELTQSTKQLLNIVAASTAHSLLNKRPQKQKFQVNQLVYVPDLLISKNIHSIMEALGRVIEVHDIHNYSIRMLSGQMLQCNVKHLLSTSTNFHTASIDNIDAFQLPSFMNHYCQVK